MVITDKLHAIINAAHIARILRNGALNERLALQAALDLSDEQMQALDHLSPLLEYHHQVADTGKGQYPLLRHGLGVYFDLFLSTVFQQLGIKDQVGWQALDYGGGSGHWGRQFLVDNPESTVQLLDRNVGMYVDFEKKPNWWHSHLKRFDLVILSEVLHCKGPDVRRYLVDSSFQVLKPGGLLLVHENLDYFMGLRLREAGEGGDVLTSAEVRGLMPPDQFDLNNRLTMGHHHIQTFKRARA